MARFIVSNRLAGKASKFAQQASRLSMEETAQSITEFASVKGKHRPKGESSRMTLIVDSDPADIEAKRKELPTDVMIEPEVLRQPASLAHNMAAAFPAAGSAGAGHGTSLDLSITTSGSPAKGIKVNVLLSGSGAGQTTMMSSTTDGHGKASINYDSSQWTPTVAIVVPKEGFWSGWQTNPQNGMVIDLTALPRTGPLGWWHQITGISQHDKTLGSGIRIGVADTGVGPHPYLTQVESIGAFVNGNHDTSANAGLDAEDHGSHVSGIINARPRSASGDFMGIAPGAEVFMARVFPNQSEQSKTGSSGANQGDIANAIDALSANNQVDLISLSLGGPNPSQIELDAIQAAIEVGALVICAAGNGNGSPVMYPAAYPQTVAVSAIGLLGMSPVGSLAAASLPTQPDRFTSWGAYLANFSNIGAQISCTGPGVGIVSTVPGRTATDPAYADMSGTSMATPAVCARLAVLLSKDKDYQSSPRDSSRALRAWMTLVQSLFRLGLDPTYEGGGLPYASAS